MQFTLSSLKNPMKHIHTLLASCVFACVAHAQVTLIDASFDDVANDTNNTFGIISNTQANGSEASWNQVTGFVNRGTTNNSSAGAVSTTTIDFPTLGSAPIILTVDFESASGVLGANGLFVGFQEAPGGANTGGNLWNNQAPSFGVVIDGGSRLGTYVVAPGGNSSTGAFQDSPAFGTTTLASLEDGFTVTLTVDTTGWDITLTGLETSGAAPITGGSGTWADVAFDFSDFTSGMRVAFTSQGNGGGSLDLASVNVVTGNVPDTDMDGMSDAYETANNTDVNVNDAALDKDGDGLSNLQEFLGHNSSDVLTGFGQTLSGTADSDGDNHNDKDEIDGTLNPWTAGTLGSPPGESTNPNEQDSDGDGTNDDVEIANNTDPNNPPPNTGPVFPFVDTDGDSFSDIAETAFGSNPTDPADCPDHSSSPAKPNVIIIYADDMGLGDMSAYGDLFGTPSPAVTPHMDALAAEGTLFTQAHSSNGVCTPSRYSLLTGKYNWREMDGISKHYGYHSAAIPELPKASDVTIAEFLKTQSYDTAAFGKWHLGGAWFAPGTNNRIINNPTTPGSVDWARPVEDHAVTHGFDIYRGLAASINFGPYVYLENDRNQIWDASLNGGSGAFRDATNSDTFKYLTTADLNSSVVGAKDSRASLGDPTYRQVDAGPFMITQVEEYLADRASSGDSDPFFAYVSLYSPHKPWALTAPFIGADSAAGFHYADFMREVDDRIGRVIAAIDNNGFHDNTIIILTSDNGPEHTAVTQSLSFGKDSNGPLRGNKRDVWEGGTRVPFVVRWPGQSAAGMKVSDPVWQGDIFASVAAYLGVDLPSSTAPDGESFLNLIRGQQKPSPKRDSIVVSSLRSDLGLKTNDGWKFIDSTGGGGSDISYDSLNILIPNPEGVDKGVPKQLFHLNVDLGEDNNLISAFTDISAIRSELTSQTGSDLLDILDQYRTTETSILYPRVANNDGDAFPNAYEIQYGLDPNSPKDAFTDLDGDGSNNLSEFIAGTDPSEPGDFFKIINALDTATEFTVTWQSVAERTYSIYWSTDLVNWTLHSTVTGTGSQISEPLDKAAIDAADTIPGNLNKLFVRITAEMPN
ncbi:MAG: sulfatase-like hydrolase/transferase [Luteolibacter sp.]